MSHTICVATIVTLLYVNAATKRRLVRALRMAQLGIGMIDYWAARAKDLEAERDALLSKMGASSRN